MCNENQNYIPIGLQCDQKQIFFFFKKKGKIKKSNKISDFTASAACNLLSCKEYNTISK